ncbi:MAG: hypothetical protein RBS68_05780 [Anaerolineales bacterium]|jgi:predicted transcriptional regulator|nr:hypothetical protein [Anaerolineales bacterium]
MNINKSQQEQPQDDFGVFLSSVNRVSKDDNRTSKTSMRIVRCLSEHNETRIEIIMAQVRAPFAEFTEGLQELSEAGLVKVDDDDKGSLIELTDEGQRWAQAMIDDGDDL